MKLGPHLQRLLEIAGSDLGRSPSRFVPTSGMGTAGLQLQAVLAQRNGFYAFESALLLRHSGPSIGEGETSVEAWNDPSLWINAYDDLADGCVFFAEDVFGGQFCIAQGGVFSFDPETGERSPVASDLEGWAAEVMRDYAVLTGFPLAHAWQERYGPLPAGTRLVPKIPFVLQGPFDVGNLYIGDAVQAMRARGHIALQIRDLPDGATIKLEVEGRSDPEGRSDRG